MAEMRKMEEMYGKYKALLFTLAYQLTGSATDAEDVVQDVFVKALDIQVNRLEEPKAYLCKMVTNRCLDMMKSARKRREMYVGPWLPEPIRTTKLDEFESVIHRDLLSYAMLVLLERLTPAERAVFVLREALSFDYTEIAELLDKREANCRKMLSRAKNKMGVSEQKMFGAETIESEWLHRFLTSLERGDASDVMNLLAEDVKLITDGGGKVMTATRPIQTRDHVVRYLISTMDMVKQYFHENYRIDFVPLNGEIGLVLRTGEEIVSVILMQRQGGELASIFIVRNPDKLTRV